MKKEPTRYHVCIRCGEVTAPIKEHSLLDPEIDRRSQAHDRSPSTDELWKQFRKNTAEQMHQAALQAKKIQDLEYRVRTLQIARDTHGGRIGELEKEIEDREEIITKTREAVWKEVERDRKLSKELAPQIRNEALEEAAKAVEKMPAKNAWDMIVARNIRELKK